MSIRLFPFNKKVNKQKHAIEIIDDEDKLLKEAEEILARENGTQAPTSPERSKESQLPENRTSKYEWDSKTADIIKAAEELLAKDKQEKSIMLFPLDKKSDQDFPINNHVSDETTDPEVQDVIFKLYPDKYKDAAIYGNSGVNQRELSYDEHFVEAGLFIIEKNKASVGLIQRVFKIGFNRAMRIMDQLAMAGVVSEESSTRARKVLMSRKEFEDFIENKDYIANKEEFSPEIDWWKKYSEYRSHFTFYFSHDVYRKAEELLNKETKALLTEQFLVPEYKVSRSLATIENLKNHKNFIITNSKFSTPTTFVLKVMEKCSPARLHLILIDDKQYFSKFRDYYLLYQTGFHKDYLMEILKWCIEERDKRQKRTLDRGKNRYEPEIETNELRIMIVVRELYSILQINGVREKLLQLLVNSYQFGIYFIGFSQYDSQNLGINTFRNMADLISEEEIFELVDDGEKDHGSELPGQLNTALGSVVSREISNIDRMDGIDFEKFCARVLKANRFTKVNVTKSSGDYGADIVAIKDQIKYAIQCKRSTTPIGNKAVQEVIASRSVYNCHVGVVLTNNYFTNGAKVLAEKNNILLWDRSELLKMCSSVRL